MFQNPGEFILWAGVQDETAALGPLKATIESALGTIGYKAQRGKLTPHSTPGRIWGELDDPPASQVRRLLDLTPLPAVEPHDVRRVSMIHGGREAGELRSTRLATAPIRPCH